jgi:phosphatidylglycerophosphatase A
MPDIQRILLSPWGFIALGFGAGLSPVWPGTAGSILGLALAWPLKSCWPSIQWLCVVAGLALGIWACERTDRALKSHDSSVIVWDEVVGMIAVALLIPASPLWWLAGFVAFRFFDIVKPWPIGFVDRTLRNGLGVMLDDVIASGYAAALIMALVYTVGVLNP